MKLKYLNIKKKMFTHTITCAILVKQKETCLPFWLEMFTNIDYPKKLMHLYIRANNCTDNSIQILKDFVKKYQYLYASIYENYSDVDQQIEKYGVHEWNPIRFKILGQIRENSINHAINLNTDYYFVCDVDNFIHPYTLNHLINVNVDVISPMLLYARYDTYPDNTHPLYSNFHEQIDNNGYYKESSQYHDLLSRRICGIVQVPVVHCTYLLSKRILSKVKYIDNTNDYEYVIFSRNMRKLGIKQYLDNRFNYGVLTLTENINAIKESFIV